MFRILITGTRENSPRVRNLVRQALDALTISPSFPLHRPIVVVHGACPYGGADQYAEEWARTSGHATEPHPADTGPRGQILGPARNSHMVSLGADYCLAFPAPGSRGTWDCLRKAVDAGIPSEVHVVGPWLTLE